MSDMLVTKPEFMDIYKLKFTFRAIVLPSILDFDNLLTLIDLTRQS